MSSRGLPPYRALTALYQYLRPYVNFFQPSLKLVSKNRKGSKVYRKYDQAQTPYQRILADKSISPSAKLKLTKQYQSLDPLDLKSHIMIFQEQLWQHADLRALGPSKPPYPELGLLFQSSKHDPMPEHPIVENMPLSSERFFRRTKRRSVHSSPRYWRTRKDPFGDVWEEVELQLQLTPQISTKTLFLALQLKYPGMFTDGQLRTLQRRVQSWRLERLKRPGDQEEIEP